MRPRHKMIVAVYRKKNRKVWAGEAKFKFYYIQETNAVGFYKTPPAPPHRSFPASLTIFQFSTFQLQTVSPYSLLPTNLQIGMQLQAKGGKSLCLAVVRVFL